MEKIIIKRFGENNLGADPNWIKERMFISKYSDVYLGWEEISNTDYKKQIDNQTEAYNIWASMRTSASVDYKQKQKDLALEVERRPDTSYKIYKYISSDIANTIDDVEIPPTGINYKTSLDYDLKADRTFKNGFLTTVRWYVWDYGRDEMIDEVLKVDIIYEEDPEDEQPINSAKSVKNRRTERQWKKENNTYDTSGKDKKITKKVYGTAIEKNEEGKRRRNNIFVDLSEDYVKILAVLKYAGNVYNAQNKGKELLGVISKELSEFISIGSDNIINKVNQLAIEDDTEDYFILNWIVPDNQTTRSLVPNAIRKKVKDYLIDKFSGNI